MRVDVTSIGSIQPSLLARNLPDGASQIAQDLALVTPEFRALADDTNVATSLVSNPQTLHRLARKADGTFNDDHSTGWKVHAGVVNYVKGQLNDDATERTYYTFGDGSAPPRVLDATGEDRLLGVPAPTTKPQVELSVVDEFTVDEEAAAIGELGGLQSTVATIIQKHVTAGWKGPFDAPPPTGYVYYQDGNNYSAATQGYVARTYRLSSTGGTYTQTITNSYSSAPAATFNWVFLPSAGAGYMQRTADCPAWQGALGTDHVFVSVRALAKSYSVNYSALQAELAAIPMPGATDGSMLFTTEDLTGTDGIITRLQSYLNPSDPRLAPMLAALNARWAEMRVLLDTVPAAGTTDAAMVNAFLAKRGELAAAVSQLEDWYALLGPNRSSDLLNAVGIVFSEQDFAGRVPAGVVRIVESRFYIQTWVTDWDEESAPGPVSDIIEPDQNDFAEISVAAPPSGRNIVGWRLYRSNSASDKAEFQLVVDEDASNAVLDDDGNFKYFAVSDRGYTDEKKASQLQEICPTMTWEVPPSNLAGLVGMPNGIMTGHFDNVSCFCEPYYGYAWPVEYQVTHEYPVVARAVFGQTVVVGHRGGVDYISGADSASMTRQANVSAQACVSARSMVSVDGGVVYASPDGLCLAGPTGVQVITEKHFTREDWQALDPSTVIGVYHERVYIFLIGTGGDQTGYAIDLRTGRLGTITGLTGSAFYVDRLNDTLYVVNGTAIKSVFTGLGRRNALWRSKILAMPEPVSFRWLEVQSEFEEPVTVRWIGDGVERYEVTLTDRTPVPLPAGAYLDHEIEVESEGRWSRLTLAGSTTELQGKGE